jgi:hypothetical protein
MKRGRPSKYKEEYAEMAYKFALLGIPDKRMCLFFEVCEDTFNEWKKQHPNFSESLTRGKEIADAEVAKSLYERAIGYSHKEEKIFCHNGEIIRAETIQHYPPETKAAALWLKNRQGKYWREKQEIDMQSSVSMFLQDISGQPLSTPMGRVQAALDGQLPDYDDDESGESSE